MKRLRVTRGMSRVKYLVVVSAGLFALAVFAVPATARHHHYRTDSDEHSTHSQAFAALTAATVNFQTSPPAIFSCTKGVLSPKPSNADSANIVFTATTVSTTVTFHGTPGTKFSGQLTQGPSCYPTMPLSGTVLADGFGTATVTEPRGFGVTGAFVAGTNGTRYEITPLVPVGTLASLAAPATVPFVNTSFALCSGGFGLPSQSTATISATSSIVTVNLNLTGLKPSTNYSVQMYQTRGFGSCLISGAAKTVKTDPSGKVTTTPVMFTRIGLPPFGLPSTAASVFVYLPPSTVVLQTPSVALS